MSYLVKLDIRLFDSFLMSGRISPVPPFNPPHLILESLDSASF